MAITLRNKVVEAKIREIGRRTGEGPSAVIARAVDMEEERLKRDKEALVRKRKAAMKRLIAMLPPVTDEDRAATQKIADDMYDEDGLPR